MVTKSIVEVDVQDGAFNNFLRLFSKYQAGLAKLPAAWNKVTISAAGTAIENNKQLEKVDAVTDGIEESQRAQKKLKDQTGSTNREFDRLKKSSKDILSNIKDTTIWLFKWSAIATAAGGLLGAGGLFGLDRLAYGAGSTRRESQGLGVTTGTLRALQLNYGKAVDVEPLLSKINEARNDVTKNWLFSANGISAADLRNKDNAQLLQQLLPNLRQRFINSNGNAANVPGLTDFADVSTLTRLKAMSNEELAAMAASAEKDKQLLATSDRTNKAWQDFSIQLSRAGQQIELTFVRGLIPLIGPLSNLSRAMAGSIKNLLGNPNMGKWIEGLGTGIESFSQYIGTPKFQEDLQKFANGVAVVAGGLYDLAAWLHKWIGTPEPPSTAPGSGFISQNKLFGDLEKQKQLPEGILDKLYAAESDSGRNVRPKMFGITPNGAVGPFQFQEETAKQYGITDRYDLVQSAGGAAAYLADLRRRYNGDMAKAVAAYNAGPTKVDAASQQYGAAWLQHLPGETQREVRVVLNVNNNTGGNAVVNSNQAAQGN
jgi:transglycosylase-like protein with SLT domain